MKVWTVWKFESMKSLKVWKFEQCESLKAWKFKTLKVWKFETHRHGMRQIESPKAWTFENVTVYKKTQCINFEAYCHDSLFNVLKGKIEIKLKDNGFT